MIAKLKYYLTRLRMRLILLLCEGHELKLFKRGWW